MPNADVVFQVPAALLPEMEIFAAALQSAAKRDRGTSDSDVKLIRTDTKPLGPGELETVVFFVSAALSAWLTKKWLDTYVWPIVQKQIDKPSRQLVDFVASKLGLEKGD
jgi:hypothetical protein